MSDDENRDLDTYTPIPRAPASFPGGADGWTDEDKFLMDHPGIPWKEKHGITAPIPPRVVPSASASSVQRMPIPYAAARLKTAAQRRQWCEEQNAELPKILYVCQICQRRAAEWPRERKRRFDFRIWQPTLTYVTPMVCSTCRIMRQPEVTALGKGRRRFWKYVLAFLVGEAFPTMGPTARRWLAYRQRFLP